MNTTIYKHLLLIWFLCAIMQVSGQSPQRHDLNAIDSLIDLSDRYLIVNPKESQAKAREALSLGEENFDPKMLAWAIETYATASYYLGERIEARKNYIKALILYTNLNDKTGISSVLHNIALIEHDNGHYLNALKLYRLSMANDRSHSDLRGMLITRNALATLYLDMEQYPKAALMLDSLLIESRQYHSPAGRLDYYINKGVYFIKTGALLRAESLFLKASSLADSLNLPEDKLIIKLNLSEVAYKKKEFLKSLHLCDQVLKTKNALNIQEISANAHLQKGLILAALDSIPKARQHLARARSLTLIGENYRQMGPIMLQIGNAQYDFKNFNEAIVSYRESVFYAKKAGMTKTLTDAYRALYTTYLKTDQQDSSALYLKKFNAMLDTLEKYNQKATIVDSNFNLYVQNAKSFAKKAKLLDEHSAKSFKLMIFFISFALLSALLYWLLHFNRFQKRK